MNVGGTAGVVTGEKGVENDHSVSIAVLDATEGGVVEIARVSVSVPVSTSNTTVYTLDMLANVGRRL